MKLFVPLFLSTWAWQLQQQQQQKAGSGGIIMRNCVQPTSVAKFFAIYLRKALGKMSRTACNPINKVFSTLCALSSCPFPFPFPLLYTACSNERSLSGDFNTAQNVTLCGRPSGTRFIGVAKVCPTAFIWHITHS